MKHPFAEWPLCLFAGLLALWVGVVATMLVKPHRARSVPKGDPYACFGGGRYDAMRQGRVCPGWEKL